jgi:hypothetical protein
MRRVIKRLRKKPHAQLVVAPRRSLPRVPRLDCVQGWSTELADLYRAARRGQLDPGDAARLAFIANAGAKLARDLEELRALDRLREAVEQAQANGAPQLTHDSDSNGLSHDADDNDADARVIDVARDAV